MPSLNTLVLPLLLGLVSLPVLAEEQVPEDLVNQLITFAGQNHYFSGACGHLSDDEMLEEREAEKEEALELMGAPEGDFYRWHLLGVEQAKEKWATLTPAEQEDLCIDLPGNVVHPDFR